MYVLCVYRLTVTCILVRTLKTLISNLSTWLQIYIQKKLLIWTTFNHPKFSNTAQDFFYNEMRASILGIKYQNWMVQH